MNELFLQDHEIDEETLKECVDYLIKNRPFKYSWIRRRSHIIKDLKNDKLFYIEILITTKREKNKNRKDTIIREKKTLIYHIQKKIDELDEIRVNWKRQRNRAKNKQLYNNITKAWQEADKMYNTYEEKKQNIIKANKLLLETLQKQDDSLWAIEQQKDYLANLKRQGELEIYAKINFPEQLTRFIKKSFKIMSELAHDQLILQKAYLDILSASEEDVEKMGIMLDDFRDHSYKINEKMTLAIQAVN